MEKDQEDAPEHNHVNAVSRLAQERDEMRTLNSHRKNRNITDEFIQTTTQLLPGQSVKDEYFTLFEAVGALEIMDPKMDSGFIPEGDTFDADFDPSAPLQAGEVIWIMDQLLCLEITWLDGYPLSQTIFTSLHVDRLIAPDNKHFTFANDGPEVGLDKENLGDILTHQILRAYCVALLKCVELVSLNIQSQTFFEEEDFVTHLFGRELLPQVSAEQASDLMMNVKGWVEQQDVLPTSMRDALEARLLFREQMLQSLLGGKLDWEDTLEGLDDMQCGHQFAIPTPDAFSAKVQRQLATSTPPRPMLNIGWDEAMTRWKHFIDDVIDAYRMTSLDAISDPQCLQRVTWAFAYRDPPPGTFARAIMQEQLFSPGGAVVTRVGHFELLLADLRNVVLAGDSLIDPASFQIELPSDPRHIRSRLLEEFVEKAVDEYLNLYRMVCQNRCRIRRTFTQAIPILDALESEGARVDQAIASKTVGSKSAGVKKDLRPLSSWAKFHKLQVMMWTVQLGFETDIYMDDELGTIYWFLTHLTLLQDDLTQHSQRHLEDRTKCSPPDMMDCFASRAFLRHTDLSNKLTQTMASALSTFHFQLVRLKIVAAPERDFAQQQLFYEARMKPYLSVTNDIIPSSEDFSAAQKRPLHAQSKSDKELTQKSSDDIESKIKACKALLVDLKKIGPEEGKYVGTEEQYKKEMKRLETTCVAIAVNVSKLRQLVEKHGENGMGGRVACEMSRRWHEWWVVPMLKEKS